MKLPLSSIALLLLVVCCVSTTTTLSTASLFSSNAVSVPYTKYQPSLSHLLTAATKTSSSTSTSHSTTSAAAAAGTATTTATTARDASPSSSTARSWDYYGYFSPRESPSTPLFDDYNPLYTPKLSAGLYCGHTFWQAATCQLPCINGDSASCPRGMTCFANVLCSNHLLFHHNPHHRASPRRPAPYSYGNPYGYPPYKPASPPKQTQPPMPHPPPPPKNNKDDYYDYYYYKKPTPIVLHHDYWCGATYWDAFRCVAACPTGDSRVCPDGTACFAGVVGCYQPASPSPTASTTSTATPTPSTTSTATATPTPTLSQTPTSSPTPSPRVDAAVQGYYQKTWTDFTGFSTSNLVVCESPTVDVKSALQHCHGFYSFLTGSRFISFGSYLTFRRRDLDDIDQAIRDGILFGYTGIAYHIFAADYANDPYITERFEMSFKTAKMYGLQTFITFETSAPKFVVPAAPLMDVLFGSQYVDFVSPRFWEDEGETPDYAPQRSFPWELWRRCNNSVVASILSSQYYEDSVRFLGQFGVSPVGWVKWN